MIENEVGTAQLEGSNKMVGASTMVVQVLLQRGKNSAEKERCRRDSSKVCCARRNDVRCSAGSLGPGAPKRRIQDEPACIKKRSADPSDQSLNGCK